MQATRVQLAFVALVSSDARRLLLLSLHVDPTSLATMGLGVLEDNKLDHVPGTVLLNDHAAHTEDVTGTLKHGTGRNAHIVLSPQPSEDPNDPLNWPLWKKETIIWILCLGAMLHAGTNGPFLNASYFEIAVQVNKPLTTVVLASGYNLLAAGCSGPLVCAFSRKYGKRHVFIISSLFDIVGTAIGEANISYKCTYLDGYDRQRRFSPALRKWRAGTSGIKATCCTIRPQRSCVAFTSQTLADPVAHCF